MSNFDLIKQSLIQEIDRAEQLREKVLILQKHFPEISNLIFVSDEIIANRSTIELAKEGEYELLEDFLLKVKEFGRLVDCEFEIIHQIIEKTHRET